MVFSLEMASRSITDLLNIDLKLMISNLILCYVMGIVLEFLGSHIVVQLPSASV